MDDVRSALSHVLWIGGGPQAGKTTLSRLLAGTWDPRIYDLDWHSVHDTSRVRSPEVELFTRQTMDERWAQPAVDALVARAVLFWEQAFRVVVEDLLALPRTRLVIAEGPGALPWCVAPLLGSPRQAIFLLPTRPRRDTVAERRWGPGQVERFPGIVDRTTALTKLRERDAILDARIADACRDLGLRCEVIDGSQDVRETLALVEDHFRELLPATPNV